MARFHLRLEITFCSAYHMGTGFRVGPRRGMNSFAQRHRHQVVIARMKLDVINAVAIAVMRLKTRFLLVGLEAPVDYLGRAGAHGVLLDFLCAPAAAFARYCFLQGLVTGPRVVV